MKFLVLLILVGFAGIILIQQAFAEDSFDSIYDFSKDFETERFSYPYGEKFYQYKSEPFEALAEESFSRCHFTSSFVLSNDSPSESGNVIYKFPRDTVWPGGHENSTFYIVRSPSFNFPEDNHFEQLASTKTGDGIVLEFDIVTGLNTFVTNSTAFWNSQRSQRIDCPDPFGFEKQEYKYDFVYPLKIQQDYAKIWELAEDDFLCKPKLIPVLKNDDSPACVNPETQERVIDKEWTAEYDETTPTVLILLGASLEENESLDPKIITVVLDKNNTVLWTNGDDVPHTFVSDAGDEMWSTGMMKPGESSSVTFNNTGIFSYHRTPHPWISVAVIAVPADYDESKLPSSDDYDFQRMHMHNACTEERSFCFGVFDNGTQIMIQCDFPIHGYGPDSFEKPATVTYLSLQ